VKELEQSIWNTNEPVTIVYIIGESINFKHLSLFGYARDTTPNLRVMAKRPDFYCTTGLSGATCTRSSVKYITSVIGEPDNPWQTQKSETNLFRLAKQHGYKTFYLSNQTDHLLTSIGGTSYIDVIRTQDSNIVKSKQLKDEYLFSLLDEQKFATKNFIILHQWSAHSPYFEHAANDPRKYEKFSGSNEKRIDEYDNAMLYVDYIVSSLFGRFSKAAQSGKFYIFWTSDHHELLGEGGRYGHGVGQLYPATADVPIVIQSNDARYLEEIKKIFKPTHYEISHSIARILGYEVVNPNEVANVFYINGVDFNGKCGYIKCIKNTQKHTVTYETIN
jgi:glucan phosphoethanolaminetransferase (alkaline phosphatase superfamily)